ncbi:MAG: ribonuclease III [Actinomycetota bacterium]|nr:ribonuclease III [Actinomycetota bacterium]
MSDHEKAVKKAQEALGIKFNDEYLLRVALTHSSFAYEIGAADFNEKLEFLGDSVLGIIITEYIFHAFPKFQEGGLAKLRANLVRAETLAEIARELRVGEFVLIGRGAEQSGGRRNESILADCMEAIIGAVYIDQGIEVTRDFIIELFRGRISEQGKAKELGDPKTTLQELTMERWSALPDYEMVSQDGPAHRPIFSAAVTVRGQVYGRGVGTSKKRAQQIAAKEALKEISKLEF